MTTVKVFIENPAVSIIKHLHNEKTLELTGTTTVSRAFPLPYGFVLHTTAEDGDNVDCFVLTRQLLKTGQIVECDPVAMMEQIEDGEVDHKILAVMPGEPLEVEISTREALVEFASHVFDHVPGKQMQVGAFRDRRAALEHVKQHQDEIHP